MKKKQLIIITTLALFLLSCEAFSAANNLTIINESNSSITAYIYESKDSSTDYDYTSTIGIGSQQIFTIPSSLRDGYYLFVKITDNNDEIEYCFTYDDDTSFTLNFWDFNSSPTYTINEDSITEVI
ncbi:MAG: hypothetical protein PQJ45_02490 [Sphaerochaetaceae bacterium]|nr:hypothetical protein [Sphaerochaetaceae bacterium]